MSNVLDEGTYLACTNAVAGRLQQRGWWQPGMYVLGVGRLTAAWPDGTVSITDFAGDTVQLEYWAMLPDLDDWPTLGVLISHIADWTAAGTRLTVNEDGSVDLDGWGSHWVSPQQTIGEIIGWLFLAATEPSNDAKWQ